MDRWVQRSVRAVKARAVTDEARRRVGLVVVLYVLYAAICDGRAAGEERGRGHRAMMVVNVDLENEKRGGRGDCSIYIRALRPRSNNYSTHTAGRPQSAQCADAFRAPAQARETTICVGSALLRQCAQALGGVSTGRRSRTCFETEPPKLPLSPDPADSRSTATRSGPGACEPRAWVPLPG